MAPSIQCELCSYNPVYYIFVCSSVYICVLGFKKVICALKIYYVTSCDSCKSLWFVSPNCSQLQLISSYSFHMFLLHSQQKPKWVITYLGGWPPKGLKDTTIRHYTKHTIISWVPQTPINPTSHSVGLPPLWTSPLPTPPTCCNHSILQCVGAQLSACWALFHDSQYGAKVSQADCYICVLLPAHHHRQWLKVLCFSHGLSLGEWRKEGGMSVSIVLRRGRCTIFSWGSYYSGWAWQKLPSCYKL